MLTAKIDTYISLEEADNYVAQYYQRLSPLRVIWSVLDEEEKESYLRSSLVEMEALMFVGRKYNAGQTLAFPRIKDGFGGYCIYPYTNMRSGSYIPEEVSNAQIENALGIIANECAMQSSKQSMTMQSLGVMDNSKVLVGGGSGSEDIPNDKAKKLSSKTAEKMLRGWLGSFRG